MSIYLLGLRSMKDSHAAFRELCRRFGSLACCLAAIAKSEDDGKDKNGTERGSSVLRMKWV